MQNFSGVWTALVTPMKESGVDYETLGSLVEAQLEAGVAGLVSVGTTGESPTLDHDEHIKVIAKTVEFALGRVPVFAGTGSNSTAEAVSLTRAADEVGASGFLVVAPYYNKPSQEGLFLHFSEIARCTQKPIFLYSIPGRCGIEISNEVAVRLREKFPHVCVMKEAGGKVEKVKDLHERSKGKMAILSGDDGLTLEFIRAGAVGVISVASNLIPAKIVEMVSLALKGEWQAAEAINSELDKLFKVLFIEPNPVPVKAAMKMAEIIPNNYVRLPLCSMLPENRAKLEEELKRLKIIG